MKTITLKIKQGLTFLYISPFIILGWTAGFITKLVLLAIAALREGFDAGRAL